MALYHVIMIRKSEDLGVVAAASRGHRTFAIFWAVCCGTTPRPFFSLKDWQLIRQLVGKIAIRPNRYVISGQVIPVTTASNAGEDG